MVVDSRIQKEDFIIFTDESGLWRSKEENFYVRSWIKIKRDDYYYLSGLLKENKISSVTKKNVKNIWKNHLNNRNLNFKVFFTFTFLPEFRERKYVPRDFLTSVLQEALKKLEDRMKNGIRKKLYERIKGDIDYIFFLYTYELFHLINFFEALCSLDSENYEIFINKPQFNEKDYYDLIKEIYGKFGKEIRNNEIHFVKNSEKILGISIADSFSSLFKDFLEGNLKETDFIWIKDLLLNSPKIEANIGINGVNKIFFSAVKYRIPKFVEKENKIIYKLKKFLYG